MIIQAKFFSSNNNNRVVHVLTALPYISIHNQINVRTLIGQSAMVYCAGKPMEILRVFL